VGVNVCVRVRVHACERVGGVEGKGGGGGGGKQRRDGEEKRDGQRERKKLDLCMCLCLYVAVLFHGWVKNRYLRVCGVSVRAPLTCT